ncbi:hypothetical protein GCM10022406_20950 [Hymenobacter algoricola]|uniref:Tail specific protease domain-containing protein n=1 Tax=Hymenobacter algoricola TaxID=486267 RepID=A0ABP7N406_9BACT
MEKTAPDTAFQNGSRFRLSKLTPQQVKNLTALGQVWGFLKYYHPAVAGGQYNWDAELFRLLPKVLASSNQQQRSETLSNWVTSLGPVAACAPCAAAPANPVRMAADLTWMEDKKLYSKALQRQLKHIQANRYQGKPYYVVPGGPGNPTFPQEAPCAQQTYPDAGLRILGLYRYWNVIQYYFPYKYAIGENWQQVLPEFLPRFIEATDALQYRLVALTLFARIHDTHATVIPDPLLTAYAGEYAVAAALQFIGGQPVVVRVRKDGLVVRPPLEPGDIIQQVDGVSVGALLKQRLPRAAGSNPGAQLATIASGLLRGATPQVQLKILRANQPLTVMAPRFKLGTQPPVRPAVDDTTYRFLTPTVGYFTMASITKAKLPAILKAFQQTKGIVVDMRNYPGEFVSYVLSTYFITQPTPFVKFTAFDPTYPGRFIEEPPMALPPDSTLTYAGQLVVLVNESTLSQAEFNAMALRSTPRCTILGSQTAGADGDVSRIVLPGNLTTRMSGIGVYYPDGRETQRVGIVPDVEMRPTAQGMREGQDELLEKARQLIESKP